MNSRKLAQHLKGVCMQRDQATLVAFSIPNIHPHTDWINITSLE